MGNSNKSRRRTRMGRKGMKEKTDVKKKTPRKRSERTK